MLLVGAAVAVGTFMYMKRKKTLAQQVAEGKISATDARMMALSRGPGTTSQVDGLGAMGAFGFPWLRNLAIRPFGGVMTGMFGGGRRFARTGARTFGMRG